MPLVPSLFLQKEEGFFMARIKEAKILVRSVIQNLDENMLPEGEDEVFNFEASGFLRYDKETGALGVRYTEEAEDGKTFTEISFERGLVRVKRHGGVSSELCFYESGIEYSGIYSVGAYSFDVSVIPLKIRNGIGYEGGVLDVFYRMCIGGAHKKTRYRIEVVVK